MKELAVFYALITGLIFFALIWNGFVLEVGKAGTPVFFHLRRKPLKDYKSKKPAPFPSIQAMTGAPTDFAQSVGRHNRLRNKPVENK